MLVAMAPDLDGFVDPVDRFAALAAPAVEEALAHFDVEGLLGSAKGVPVVLALPEPRPGLSEEMLRSIGRRILRHVSGSAPVSGTKVMPIGHAGGVAAFGRALDVLKEGRSDLLLVGGVESYLFGDTLDWLDGIDQLHSERTTWGFSPGEAAAFCLLASPGAVRKLGLEPMIDVISEGSAVEPNRNLTETVCIGAGMTAAWRAALEKAAISEPFVAHTICDMNGDPYRGNEVGFAMLRTKEYFLDKADFETPAECWGDVGAASGPLFAVLAAMAQSKGYAPGPYTLAFAGSDGGVRSAMVLAACQGEV